MTSAIAWAFALFATAGICAGVANAVTNAGLRWLRTRPRPAKPRPTGPIGPEKPYYQRGQAPMPCGDVTSTERMRRMRDHAPRLTRRVP